MPSNHTTYRYKLGLPGVQDLCKLAKPESNSTNDSSVLCLQQNILTVTLKIKEQRGHEQKHMSSGKRWQWVTRTNEAGTGSHGFWRRVAASIPRGEWRWCSPLSLFHGGNSASSLRTASASELIDYLLKLPRPGTEYMATCTGCLLRSLQNSCGCSINRHSQEGKQHQEREFTGTWLRGRTNSVSTRS